MENKGEKKMKLMKLYPSIKESLGLCSYCEEEQGQRETLDGEEGKFLCDRCTEYFTYCNVCGFYCTSYCEHPCRHLHWCDDSGIWIGCGSDADVNDHKKSFFLLLNKIGIEAALCLLKSVQKHKYHNSFSGTIFGWNSLDAYWLKGKRTYNFGDLITDNLDSDDEDALEYGMAWLMSLWADYYKKGTLATTRRGDRITVKWIEEWMINKAMVVHYLLVSISDTKTLFWKHLN